MGAFNFLEKYLDGARNVFFGDGAYINSALNTARRNVVKAGLPLLLTGSVLLLASSGTSVSTPNPAASSKPAAAPVPSSILTYRGSDGCSLYNLFLTKISRSPNPDPTRERMDIINMDFLALPIDDKPGVTMWGEGCGLRDSVPVDLGLYAQWVGGEKNISLLYPSRMPNFQSMEARGDVEVPTGARVEIVRKKLTRVADESYLQNRGIPREEPGQTLNGLTPTSREQLLASVHDIFRSRIIDEDFFARYEPRTPLNIINQAVLYSGDKASITIYLKNTGKTDVDLRGMSFRPRYALAEDGRLIGSVSHNPEIPFIVDRETIPPGYIAKAQLVVSRADLRVPNATYVVGNLHGLGADNTQFPEIIGFR